MAERIARALGDDPALYRAWAQALGRSDFVTVMSAAGSLMRHAALAPESLGVPAHREAQDALAPVAFHAAHETAGEPRLLVPVLASGVDPGDAVAARGRAQFTLAVAARDLPAPETLVRPFGYVVSERDTARVSGLLAGQLALFSRSFVSIEPERVHAVRMAGRVALARLMWNGETLLVLPGRGRNDFTVLPAPGRSALAALVVGVLVRVFLAETVP